MAPPDELPSPVATPEQARDAADEVLSRPEFRQPPESLYERVTGWLNDALDRVLSTLFAGGRDSIVAWVIVAAGVAVVAWLVYRLATSATRDRRVRRPGPRAVIERPRPASEWDAEAVAHAAAGRWRDVLRCRHRALVARLAALGELDEVDGRTAGEYRRALAAARPDAAASFADATALFERAWYGNRTAGASDDERFRQLADAVLVTVGGTVR